jgi:hypothetical protein
MSPASYCHHQVPLPSEVHGSDNIGRSSWASDQAWVPIDHGVPYLAGLVIERLTRADQRAAVPGAQRINGRVVDRF